MSEVQVPDLAPCQGLEGPVPRRDGVFEGANPGVGSWSMRKLGLSALAREHPGAGPAEGEA